MICYSVTYKKLFSSASLLLSKQNRLKSAIPIGAEIRGITQIFETAILFQKKEPEYNSGVLNPSRNKIKTLAFFKE